MGTEVAGEARQEASERTLLTLRVEGMDCASCAAKIEERLARLPGVASATVYFGAAKAAVSHDPEQCRADDVIRAIRALGYKASPAEVTGGTRWHTSRIGDLIRFAFVAVIALFALTEVVLERLGVAHIAMSRVPWWAALAAVLVGGYPIFRRAILGLRARQINSDLLMSVAIFAALVIREFMAAAMVVFFMLIAHSLEQFTVRRSRRAIESVVALAPSTARVLREDGEAEVPIEQLRAGDTVIVRPGERIPVDGEVISGRSVVNQAPITGESLPVEKSPGDGVFAGTMNQLGALQVRAAKVGPDSTLGRIIALVQEAEAAKAPVQKFADRYSTYFLPIVLAASALTYLITRQPIPSIAVLIVACPCAVAVATPLAVVAGIGNAAGRGLMIKGGLHLESLAMVDTLVMDKTGTITFGRPRVVRVLGVDGDDSEPLRLAASLERFSEHPLADTIVAEARARGMSLVEAENFEALPGRGLSGTIGGKRVLVGSARAMSDDGLPIPDQLALAGEQAEREGETVFYIAADSRVIGLVGVADTLRDEVPAAFEQLRGMGLSRLILLTGDNERVASALAERLGIEEWHANMLPEEKIERIRRLQIAGRKVAMVGDGINDAPALAQADVGIAMGAAGSEAALEAADIALMRDDWLQVPQVVRLARRSFRTIKQNLAFGVLFNVFGVGLASVGILTPVLAAAAQSLPDVLVFLNSSRLLRYR
jgi:Cd2+/Zn2+-exporting ATPase/Cu+-exporting ATPase